MDKKQNDIIVDINNAEFVYEATEETEEARVLKGVSLQVKRGEFLAVLGHNGSGKSTLAKHINAILVPKKGSVEVEGLDTSDEELLFEIRQRVGMVFQNPDNQLVATVVEEDVAFGPENLGVEPTEIRRRVDHALEVVGMSNFAHHSPHQLSGGQKQRIAIAGILALSPDIIIFDESTAMLDPVGRLEVMNTIKRLNRDEGKTIILITHYMEEAIEADRVVVIDDGSILLDGTPRDVFSKTSVLRSAGLDVPQVTELLNELGDEGIDIRRDALTAEEGAKAISELIGRMKR